MKTKTILQYSLLLKWYLAHGLQTMVYKFTGQWFTKEVSSARMEGDLGPLKNQLGDTFVEQSFTRSRVLWGYPAHFLAYTLIQTEKYIFHK